MNTIIVNTKKIVGAGLPAMRPSDSLKILPFQYPETIKQPLGCLLNCSRYVYVTVSPPALVVFLYGNVPSRYSATHFSLMTGRTIKVQQQKCPPFPGS